MIATDQIETDQPTAIPIESLRRAIETASVPTLENLKASLVSPRGSEGQQLSAEVIRLSALGTELLLDNTDDVPSLGASITVTIFSDDTQTSFKGPICALEEVGPDQVKLAIRFSERRTPPLRDVERRQKSRWNCPEQFYPTGVASHPSKYNDFVYFRVFDISEGGFRLLTSMRNRFLAPQMALDCILSFPMVSQIAITVTVKNLGIVSENEKDYLAVGVEAEQLSRHHHEVISQYLAQFADYESIAEMKTNGFRGFRFDRVLDYSFATTASDYRSALELRYLAYDAEGKTDPQDRIDDMSDVFDSRSRILICRKGDLMIGTARLTFHEHADSLEHEQYVSWPAELPRRDEVVEVTRLCAHPEFQGTGVFFSLLRFCVVTAVQARRNWVVSSATSELVPIYESVGLKRVGVTFNHPGYRGIEHHLLLGNIQDAMLGRSSNAIMWNLVWKDAFAFMAEHTFINVDVVSRVRLALYRAISPAIPIVRRILSHRRTRRQA